MKFHDLFETETMVGKMAIIVSIAGGVMLLVCASVFLSDSFVREYRVFYTKTEDVYYVKAIVKNGADFNSFRTHDGREAAQMARELNEDLMRDRGVVWRNGRIKTPGP